jgi:2-keto-4-pentenoate hydratase
MAMQEADAKEKAQALYEARRNRKPIPPFTDSEPNLGMGDGYAIQNELVKMILADGDSIIGYKAGATSLAMQKLIGIDSPDYGPVLESTVYRDGGEIPLDRFIQPKIEAEIGVILGARLEGPDVSYDQTRAAISHIVGAMEIVDSRIEDWRITLADTVADLASNGAIVVSDLRVPAGELDFKTIKMKLFRNGEQIDKGAGAAALGDPVVVVTWLANVLAADGIALEPGHIVMTGALHAAVPLAPGDQFRVEFDHLGSLSVGVVAGG